MAVDGQPDPEPARIYPAAVTPTSTGDRRRGYGWAR
jgi:hypothetical protein